MNLSSKVLYTNEKRVSISIYIIFSLLILFLMSACSNNSHSKVKMKNQSVAASTALRATANDTTVLHLQLKDFTYVPDTLRIPAGKPVKIMMKNTGTVVHEFMAGKGGVRKDKHGFRKSLFRGITVHSHHGMVGTNPSYMMDIKPKHSASISFTLPASDKGTWKMGCFRMLGNKTHYQLGMKGIVIVQ